MEKSNIVNILSILLQNIDCSYNLLGKIIQLNRQIREYFIDDFYWIQCLEISLSLPNLKYQQQIHHFNYFSICIGFQTMMTRLLKFDKNDFELSLWEYASTNQVIFNRLCHIIKDRMKLKNSMIRFATFHSKLVHSNVKLDGMLLKYIPEVFCTYQNIIQLDLSNNDLRDLPYTIGNLEKLQVLDISRNQLISLPPSFQFLNKLLQLNLSQNKLYQIPASISKLQSLLVLDISKNSLVAIHDDHLPYSLEKLMIWGNDIQECEYQPNLNLLELDASFITIPVSPLLVNLKSIERLILTCCQLHEVPSCIYELASLTFLDLSFNSIFRLSSSISNLGNLQTLIISFNKLQYLPNELTLLQHLKELQLCHNQLEQLPCNFHLLTSMNRLFLHGNGLKSIDQMVLDLDCLTRISLSGNPLLYTPKLMPHVNHDLKHLI